MKKILLTVSFVAGLFGISNGVFASDWDKQKDDFMASLQKELSDAKTERNDIEAGKYVFDLKNKKLGREIFYAKDKQDRAKIEKAKSDFAEKVNEMASNLPFIVTGNEHADKRLRDTIDIFNLVTHHVNKSKGYCERTRAELTGDTRTAQEEVDEMVGEGTPRKVAEMIVRERRMKRSEKLHEKVLHKSVHLICENLEQRYAVDPHSIEGAVWSKLNWGGRIICDDWDDYGIPNVVVLYPSAATWISAPIKLEKLFESIFDVLLGSRFAELVREEEETKRRIFQTGLFVEFMSGDEDDERFKAQAEPDFETEEERNAYEMWTPDAKEFKKGWVRQMNYCFTHGKLTSTSRKMGELELAGAIAK